LRWADLECSLDDFIRRYQDRSIELENQRINLDTKSVWLAAARYGNAIAHISTMYRHLAAKAIPFELEISVDETDIPTTLIEHIIIASELKRLGVRWVSLAPRFVGRFEKGVEYIGDLAALKADMEGQAVVARALGPYKLSLHSGSDKFRVYPLIVAATHGMVHFKTAGTSYLEGLRVAAWAEPNFFRKVYQFAADHYLTDRASYHVSARLSEIPDSGLIADADLATILDKFDARQVFHVTFGTVLDQFGSELKAILGANEEKYYMALEGHFKKHLIPFYILKT